MEDNDMTEDQAGSMEPLGGGITLPSYEQSYNLAPEIFTADPAWFKEKGAEVVRLFNEDKQSCKDYFDKCGEVYKVYFGQMPPKDPDFAETASVHVPIMAEAVDRIHARMYQQRLPPKGELLVATPTGPDDEPRERRLTKHLNWQLRNQIREYRSLHDVNMTRTLLVGSAFTYVYYDAVKRRPCLHALPTTDVVMAYTQKTEDLSLLDVPRYTIIWRKHARELRAEEKKGVYFGVEAALKAGDDMDIDEKDAVRMAGDEAAGRKEWTDDPQRPRVILEQHTWCKLPGGDTERPVIVTVDRASQSILGVYLREDEDPRDRARYDREMRANEAQYMMMMQEHQQKILMHQARIEALQSQAAILPPEISLPPMPEPPAPPEMPPEPVRPEMVPISFITHYVCKPNPAAAYGIGVGMELCDMNKAADTLMAQYVDLGTLANNPVLIFSRQMKFLRGAKRIKPGAGLEVDTSGMPLKGMYEVLQFPHPNPAMAGVVRDIKEDAKDKAGASDVLVGEGTVSREAAATSKIRATMAMENLTILGQRYDASQSEEAKKIARINARTLDEMEYASVVMPGDAGKMAVEAGAIGRHDYYEDFDISFTADPRMATQTQRVDEAREAMNIMTQLPPGLIPLPTMQRLAIAAMSKLYKAMDMPDMAAIVDQAPAVMPPPGMGGPMNGPPGPTPPKGPEQESAGPPKRPPGNGAGPMPPPGPPLAGPPGEMS